MSSAEGFPPIAGPGARILILGSMPGGVSLEKQQYYAHPRNAFWPIMGALLGAGPELPYEERCRVLVDNGVAVWDVLQRCWRPGSLDASIRPDSEVANDFATFFAQYPDVETVCFNGGKAAQAFRRHVLPLPDDCCPQLHALPSTSPAHAAMTREEKQQRWAAALGCT